MSKITIIDIIGDTLWTSCNDPQHYKNKNTQSDNIPFNDMLFNEQNKYEENYNKIKEQLRKELINEKLLVIKTNENKERIKYLIDQIKTLNYNPKKYNVDNELEKLLMMIY